MYAKQRKLCTPSLGLIRLLWRFPNSILC